VKPYHAHTKIPGFVEHVDGGGRWTARILLGDDELIADMLEPLPRHAQAGSLFTIHQTKAGATYLYWITEPRTTRRQIKLARQRARRWAALFA
jgi:hypothetical protein